MADALSVERCATISAVKPLLNHLVTEVLVNSENDGKLMKEIKERIKVYVECRYASQDADVDHLLQLSCF